MQLLSNRLEDLILTLLLLRGSLDTSELLTEIQKEHSCTKQGFYKALRKLKEQERIIVYRSAVSINEQWLRQLRQLIESDKTSNSIVGDFSKLEKGETLTLTLNGLTAMDRIWTHIFSTIEEHVPKDEHLFLYNPHNWSGIIRLDSDKAHDILLGQKGRKAFLLIGSNTTLDKLTTKYLSFSNIEVSYSQKTHQEVYIAVISEYVIEVRFNTKTRVAIDLLFRTETNLAHAKNRMEKLDKSVSSKITIVKDSKKAAEWRKRISKNFFIPRTGQALNEVPN